MCCVVAWCNVLCCVVAWCNVLCCAVAWCNVLCCAVAWYNVVWVGVVCCPVAWCGAWCLCVTCTCVRHMLPCHQNTSFRCEATCFGKLKQKGKQLTREFVTPRTKESSPGMSSSSQIKKNSYTNESRHARSHILTHTLTHTLTLSRSHRYTAASGRCYSVRESGRVFLH